MVNKRALAVVAIALVTALILSSLIFPSSVQSARQANPDAKIFLRIDNIKGESKDRVHRDEIDVLAINWSEAMPHADEEKGVNMEDFHFKMLINKASPKLFRAVAAGTEYDSAVLTVATSGVRSQDFLKWEFWDVTITSFSTSCDFTAKAPTDEFSIAFHRIRITYRPILPTGAVGPEVVEEWNLDGT